jgi:hypothetical protein
MTAPAPQPDLSTGPFWRSPLFLISMALVIAIVVAILIHWDLLGFEKRAYIAKNEQILNAIPLVPGAEPLAVQTHTYFGDGQLSPAAGYQTVAAYRIPRGMTWDEVISFYAEQLADDWAVSIRGAVAARSQPAAAAGPPVASAEASPSFLTATRGRAVVSIHLRTDGPAGSRPVGDEATQHSISVDSHR